MTILAQEEHDTKYWPYPMQRLAAIIGPERTLHLVKQCGEYEMLYICDRPDHPWALALERDEFEKILKVLGGTQFSLPNADFRRVKKPQIIELYEQGLSWREVARRTGATGRYVRRVLRDAQIKPPTAQQLVERLAGQGKDEAEIVAAVGVTPRFVRKVLAALAP